MVHKRISWLIILPLTCIALGLVVVAAVYPHGLVAAGLASAAAMAAIVAAVAPLISSSGGKPVLDENGRNQGQVRTGPADSLQTPISGRDPHDLGVYRAVWPSDQSPGSADLTPYLRRDHDVQLDGLIETAANSGGSVCAVLVGGSATGKTRALFEALNRHPSVREWPLYYPADVRELVELLVQRKIGPRSVLWLNETQRYLYGESASEAAQLVTRLVAGTAETIVVGAMWPEYWLDLTRKGASGDPNAAARELLDQPGRRIDVVDYLKTSEILELAAVSDGDRRVAAAVAAAGEGGQVIQNLTGGPELLARYVDGSLFSPTEHALVTAALDARRLGHQSPLSSQLLVAAADGYVNDRQRPDRQGWLSTLTALADGERGDAHKTPIAVRTLTALIAHRVRGQAYPDYEPSDFLDQHTRQLRQARRGPAALWDALVTETADPRDLYRLGDGAERRGLDRYAAKLWLQASARGDTSSAVRLTWVIARTGNQPMLLHAASWIADHVDLAQPAAAGQILNAFYRTGVGQQLDFVAQRAAANADVTDPRAIGYLVRRLREVGADDHLLVLAHRVSEYAEVADPRVASYLIVRLRDAGLGDQLTQLFHRAATCADLGNPQYVGSLIRQMREAGAEDGLALLLGRDPAGQADLTSPRAVSILIDALRECRSGPQLTALGHRAAAHVNLADNTISYLIDALVRARLSGQLAELTHRATTRAALIDPSTLGYVIRRTYGSVPARETAALARQSAARANLISPLAASVLIHALHDSDADDQVGVLADRAVANCDLTNPRAVARLIEALVIAGANDKVAPVADRTVSDCDATDPQAVSHLIGALYRAGAGGHAAAMAERAVEHADLANPSGVVRLIQQLRESGLSQQLSALSARLAENADLSNPAKIASLIGALLRVDANEQVATLLSLDPAGKADMSNPSAIARLLDAMRAANADIQLASLSQRAAAHADISNPQDVANLVSGLLRIGASEQVSALLSRSPAEHAELSDAASVATLIEVLERMPDRAQLAVLTSRAAANANVSDPYMAARLVGTLARADTPAELAIFARRAAEHTDLINQSGVTALITTFREVGSYEEARLLAARAADAGVESAFRTVIELESQSSKTDLIGRYGREPETLPSRRWSWQDLDASSRMPL